METFTIEDEIRLSILIRFNTIQFSRQFYIGIFVIKLLEPQNEIYELCFISAINYM